MFPPDLFEGLAGICGSGVLETVSPALPDDPDSPSTNPSAKGLCQSGISCPVSRSCRWSVSRCCIGIASVTCDN